MRALAPVSIRALTATPNQEQPHTSGPEAVSAGTTAAACSTHGLRSYRESNHRGAKIGALGPGDRLAPAGKFRHRLRSTIGSRPPSTLL